MRFLFFTLLVTPCLLGAQQRYISSAIIAYSGGAYERTIRDLNSALEDPTLLTREEAAKAYFYRGLARLKLAGANPTNKELGTDPFLSASSDLSASITLDKDKWSDRTEELYDELYAGLWQAGVDAYKRSEFVKSIDHMKAALVIRSNAEVNTYLGKAYEALGENYSRLESGRDVANYRAAVYYLEVALETDPSCRDCARSLVNVATKLNDEERVKKYQQLID